MTLEDTAAWTPKHMVDVQKQQEKKEFNEKLKTFIPVIFGQRQFYHHNSQPQKTLACVSQHKYKDWLCFPLGVEEINSPKQMLKSISS